MSASQRRMPGRALVVGAGAFGAAAALELRRRGAAVTLVDPGPLPHPDAASTDISKIVRMDYGDDAFYTDLAAAAIDGWEAWNRDWPSPVYHPVGFLVLAGGAMAPGGFENDSHACLAGRGHPVERLDRAAFRRRFPAWDPAVFHDGYLSLRGGWVESGAAVAMLVRLCRRAGVELVAARADRLLEESGRVAGVALDGGGELRAEVTIVAAGAWTPRLVPRLGDVMTARGQPVLHFRVDPDRFRPPAFPPWAYDIANTGMYGLPALPDGTLKVARHGGGIAADPDGTRVVPPEEEARFREFLARHIPAAAAAPLVTTRLCLYCDTFDGDFWIDRDPARAGLVVAAGGSGHGFKFAPVLGTVIADVVAGRQNTWASRFAWREPGTGRRERARAG